MMRFHNQTIPDVDKTVDDHRIGSTKTTRDLDERSKLLTTLDIATRSLLRVVNDKNIITLLIRQHTAIGNQDRQSGLTVFDPDFGVQTWQ